MDNSDTNQDWNSTSVPPSRGDDAFDPGSRFELRRRLGAGGMGVVYEAFDGERQELVALKTLQRAGYATVFEQFLHAWLASVDPGQSPETTVTFLRQAVEHARDQDMALHHAAALHYLGSLVGGDEGADRCAEATAWADREGIVDPDRMFRIVAPGCSQHDRG
jgi:hypothetical protein